MENEHPSIHDFEFATICDYFSGLERQGPGSPEVTIQALSFIDNLTETSRIADLGCGTGGQTMVLAQHAPGQISGLDLFPDFINLFQLQVEKLGLQDRVHGMVGTMAELPFEHESLDLIWSEGAIYNVGFLKGLTEWRNYLKTGGYIAVSEACWFTDERPAEIDAFWQEAYTEIDTIPVKVAQLQAAGYIPVASFILPETCWTDHYFYPQAALQEDFLKTHAGNKTAEDLVATMRLELEMYLKYKAYYGYVFYIGKKI